MTLHSDRPNTFLQPPDHRDHTPHDTAVGVVNYPLRRGTHAQGGNNHGRNNRKPHGRYPNRNKKDRQTLHHPSPPAHASWRPSHHDHHSPDTHTLPNTHTPPDQGRVLTVFLPHIPLFHAVDMTCSESHQPNQNSASQLFNTWSELPANPLHGLPGDDAHGGGSAHKTPRAARGRDAPTTPLSAPFTGPAKNTSSSMRSTAHTASQAVAAQPPTPSSSSSAPYAAAQPAPSSHPPLPRTHPFSSSSSPPPPPPSVPSTSSPAAFCCDVCQKEFADAAALQVHSDTHMRCHVPGCRFTCRSDKAWKMEEHVQLLHRRPDAPDLLDTTAYLAQRRRRYPTQAQVSRCAEELYYKAARGVPLSSERRRWLRQHGLSVNKRAREEPERMEEEGVEEEQEESRADSQDGVHAVVSNAKEEVHVVHSPAHSHGEAETDVVHLAAAQVTAGAPYGIGEVTDKLQSSVRSCRNTSEKAGEEKEVERVAEGHVLAAGMTDLPCRSRCDDEEEEADAASGGDGDAESADEDAPPAEQCARAQWDTARQNSSGTGKELTGGVDATKGVVGEMDGGGARERTRVLAPVAATKLLAKTRGGRGAGGVGAARRQPGGRSKAARVECTPSLYERLTEEDRLAERGVLLQAVRFFVSRNFLS